MQARHETEAVRQGEAARLSDLRRRCIEAEEKLRRAEFESVQHRLDMDELRQRVAASDAVGSDKVKALKPGSAEASALSMVLSAAYQEVKSAGTEAAARAETEAVGFGAAAGGAHEQNVFRELADAMLDPSTGKALKTWTVEKWLESLGLSGLVADVLLQRLRTASPLPELPAQELKQSQEQPQQQPQPRSQQEQMKQSAPRSTDAYHERLGLAPSTERAFARQLGEHGSRELVFALLREAPLTELVADAVWGGLKRLTAEMQYARSTPLHKPLVHKMCNDGLSARGFVAASTRLAHGGLDVILGGLGSPLVEAWGRGGGGSSLPVTMRAEHCERPDSRERFSSPEYGISTTSETEYWFVTNPERGLTHLGLSAWPAEAASVATGSDPNSVPHSRRPQPLRDFDVRWKQVNAKLLELGCPLLRREELLAARLLTSPMRLKYNLSLRALAAEDPHTLSAHERLCGRNFYPATIHLMNAALHKLAKLSSPGILYRGLPGGVAPQAFWKADHRGVRGAMEAGVLSCVRTPTAALQHGVRGAGGLQATLLSIREGVGNAAAELSWLSEYPGEQEHAFPPLTSLVVHSASVEGGCVLLHVQPSLCLLGGRLFEAERQAVEARDNQARGLVSHLRSSVSASKNVSVAQQVQGNANAQLQELQEQEAARGLPLISKAYTAVSSSTGKRLKDASLVLQDAQDKRWELGGGGLFEIPLREVSEGIATLTASCRGHVDGVVKVRVLLAESDGQRRGLPDSESAGASVGGGGRVHCLDETSALKMHPSISRGTFMAALKWDAAGVAELLDVHCFASDGAHGHRGEPPTDDLFVEFSVSSRGGPQILQARMQPGQAYTIAVNLHTLSPEAERGSDAAKQALSLSLATLVIYRHNQPPLKMKVSDAAHASGGDSGGGGAFARLFGGSGAASRQDPSWWVCATLRTTASGDTDTEVINQLADQPPTSPKRGYEGKPAAGD